ncbi:hypothetical protein OSB04_006118 [Centaurea solstitialis]|uniref:Reverse transcriptase Ty1/copia-type domain-containing protein n=1 Tax=Centaurea solstitialis TaxID=347529 RepID=A0AA38TPW5_9ASTR|nr:hypothetical protein OSB04_006118 [Centaurea solstitialis]
MSSKNTNQITAATHLTTKLTATNFPVWRKHVESTLIWLELEDFIGESAPPPRQIDDKDGKKSNPEYLPWYRKDQMVLSAILGSCSDQIQPLISSATTAREAWERLNASFASSSRSRIISLKSKLVKNPKGTRSIAEFLQDMRSIADDLALAQSPVTEEDLMVHVLSQLGDEYNTIAAVIKVRDNPLSFAELFDKLQDYERALKDHSSAAEPSLTTANYTSRQQNQSNRPTNSSRFSGNRNNCPNTSQWPNSNNNNNNGRAQWNNSSGNRNNQQNSFCQYCNIPGHHTRDCRKLARFLRENNVTVHSSPTANVTTVGSTPPTWLFDTGASDHVTSDRTNLHNVSEYGGPDEISLGDVYLINRFPTSILSHKSPFECLFGQSPNYSKLKPFGCLCYPWLRPYTTSKLQPGSSPCLFLGYSSSKSTYKCYDPTTCRLYHSRHVEFIANHFPSLRLSSTFVLPTPNDFLKPTSTRSEEHSSNPTPFPAFSSSSPLSSSPPSSPTSAETTTNPLFTSLSPPSSTTSHSPSDTPPASTISPLPNLSSSQSLSPPSLSTTSSPSSTTEPTSPPFRRTRKPNTKYFNPSFVNLTSRHPIPPSIEPHTYNQALKDPHWRHAMDQEFNALMKNGTWELVPPSHPPIGCKWIFRIKRDPDGTIAKYKARLVVKGYLQQYGKDYFDTFSPVSKPVTIRTVLSIALYNRWPLRQLDVNNVFLHGTLHEEVYMIQPPGFVHPQFPTHICKLKKSLYGLKQAPRMWYIELTTFLLSLGFGKSRADPSLFIYNQGGILAYLIVNVDDLVLTGNNNSFLDYFVLTLANRFSIKDLGPLHHFLGIEVVSTPTGLFLSQHHHIQDLLTTFHMDGAKKMTLTALDGTANIDPTPYRKLVGGLQYLAFTRPDISFAVNKLSQFMHSPTETHWQALKQVLRYLKGTIYHGLFLTRGSSMDLKAFSDSDWGGLECGGRSTTAYLLYLGSNVISWRSARQKSISRSSTEAEYKALANATFEVSWVQNLLHDLGVATKSPPTLYCDNT